MSKPPEIWAADLLRVAGALQAEGEDDLRRLAERLGLLSPGPAASASGGGTGSKGKRASGSRRRQAPPDRQLNQTPTQQHTSGEHHESLYLLRAERDPDFQSDLRRILADVVPMPRPTSAGAVLLPAPLLDDRKAPALVAKAAAVAGGDGLLHIEDLVQRFARGEAITRLPCHPRPTLRRGVQWLEDWGDGMAPFLNDLLYLRKRVRSVIGKEVSSILRFAGDPRVVGDGPRRKWRPYAPPPAGVPVVAVTDLGIGGAEDSVVLSVWRRLAETLRERGSSLTIITPYPHEDWPYALRSLVRLVEWVPSRPVGPRPMPFTLEAEDTAAGEAVALLRETDPAAYELAKMVSLAVRIEPALLRRLREEFLPGAAPAIEAQFWLSPVVEARTPDAVELWGPARDILRQALAADRSKLRQVWDTLEEVHADVAPAFRLEEKLCYLALAGASADEMEAVLRPALAALVLEGRSGIAAWSRRALPQLPEPVRQTAAFHQLLALAKQGTQPSGGPDALDEDWPEARHAGPDDVFVTVERRGDDLVLRYPAAGPAPVISAPLVGDAVRLEVRLPHIGERLQIKLKRDESVNVYSASEAVIATVDGRLYRFVANIGEDAIRWIHVADLYSGGTEGRVPLVRDLVLKSIETHGPPDFIFISGDLAYSGKADQYHGIAHDFLDPVRAHLGADWRGRILAVPGNHDFDRSAGDLRYSGDPTGLLQPSAASAAQRQRFVVALAAYADFERKHTDTPADWLGSTGGAYTVDIDVRGRPVTIVGLNTAWLSAGTSDDVLAQVGVGLLEEQLKHVDPEALCIVLGHHSVDAFQTDRRRFQRILADRKAIYLHAHDRSGKGCLVQSEPFIELRAGLRMPGRGGQHDRGLRVVAAKLDFSRAMLRLVETQPSWKKGMDNWDEVASIELPIPQLLRKQEAWNMLPAASDRRTRAAFRRWIVGQRDRIRSAEAVDALWCLAQVLREKEGGSVNGLSNWKALVAEFGLQVAEAAREGWLRFWPRWRPPMPSDFGDSVVVPRELIIGSIGLAIAVDEGLDFISLSSGEAETAALYALEELNGAPAWMDRLAEAHFQVTFRVLKEWLDAEASAPSVAFSVFDRLRERPVMSRVAMEAFSMRNALRSRSGEFFDAAMRFLIRFGATEKRKEVLGILATGVRSASSASEMLPILLAAWLWLDATAALPSLKDAAKRREAGTLFVSLCARLNTWIEDGSPLSPPPGFLVLSAVEELLPLVVSLVPPSEDPLHEDAFKPDQRDKAGYFRNFLLRWLVDRPETARVRQRLARDERLAEVRPALLRGISNRKSLTLPAAVRRRARAFILDVCRRLDGTGVLMAQSEEIIVSHIDAHMANRLPPNFTVERLRDIDLPGDILIRFAGDPVMAVEVIVIGRSWTGGVQTRIATRARRFRRDGRVPMATLVLVDFSSARSRRTSLHMRNLVAALDEEVRSEAGEQSGTEVRVAGIYLRRTAPRLLE